MPTCTVLEHDSRVALKDYGNTADLIMTSPMMIV
jgi:hypothetical protein